MAKEIEVRPNRRFDREREDVNNAMEEDLPIGTIHVVKGLHDPDLKNRIQGEI